MSDQRRDDDASGAARHAGAADPDGVSTPGGAPHGRDAVDADGSQAASAGDPVTGDVEQEATDRDAGDPDAGDPDAGDPDAYEDGTAPLEELIPDKPLEARAPMRSPWALGGTAIAGGVMGAAEVVPGFSGGTVALVVGIYERLVATIRQGARTLSLLIRARPKDAWRAFVAIEWPFIIALLIGMALAVFSLAEPLSELLDERVVEMQAIFLGLVLGAAVVAGRQLRTPTPWYVLVGVAAAAATFVGLGVSPGTIDDPSRWLLLLGAAVAVCAWILPGVSGSFLLVVLGLYPAVIGTIADRDPVGILVLAAGLVLGLASFSTLLNWLLARAHDVVLATLIGLMVGSVRVLWPWPTDAGFGNTELGVPEGSEVFLAAALALAAFSLVYMFGLASSAVEQRILRRRARLAAKAAADGTPGDDARGGGSVPPSTDAATSDPA